MSHFKKELWMTPSGQGGAIDCGTVDCVMPDKPDGALENALAEAAEKENAISVRKLHDLMQSAAESAAKEIKERAFVRKNVCNGAVDYVIPDATGLVCVVAKPVALSERQPVDSEKNEKGQCYYGQWWGDSWSWMLSSVQLFWATHFLPAGVEVLPAACFAPEEETSDTELHQADWNIEIQKAELSYDVLYRKHYVYVRANIQRKDKRAFDSVVGKFIEIYRDGRLFEIETEKIRHFVGADNLVSASADIFCKFSCYEP